MSWYVTVTPGVGDTTVATEKLTGFLSSLEALRPTGPTGFESAAGQPWVQVILAKRGPTGGYACTGEWIPEIDIVELVCSDHANIPGWYESLASRIAAFLGWIAEEEGEERQIWPRLESRPSPE